MSKHVEISVALRDELEQGKYPQGSRFPSEGELADRFGVSTITINKAVGLLVEQGYLSRSGSRRGGTIVRSGTVFPRGLIGIVICLTSSFHNRILSGALNAAFGAGYALLPIPADSESLENRLAQLSGGTLAGLLSMSETRLSTSLPTVYIDKTNLDHYPDLYQVRCDSLSGGRAVAEFLLREGHRDIVYFHSSRDLLSQVPRRRGFVETLRRNGIPEPESRIFTSSSASLHGYCRTLEEMRSRFPDFTALACENDICAFEMQCAGRKLGVDIGGKIRLTGFGNLHEIQLMSQFPSVEQHPEETGYRACRKLLEILTASGTSRPLLEELPVELTGV